MTPPSAGPFVRSCFQVAFDLGTQACLYQLLDQFAQPFFFLEQSVDGLFFLCFNPFGHRWVSSVGHCFGRTTTSLEPSGDRSLVQTAFTENSLHYHAFFRKGSILDHPVRSVKGGFATSY